MPTVYGLSTCSHCKATKRYLDRNDIAYEEVLVNQLTGEERDKTVAYVKELTGGTVFPITVADNGEFVVGFDRVGLQELLGFSEKPRPEAEY